MELSISWFCQDFYASCANNFPATKWLNLNNPYEVRVDTTTELEPFLGSDYFILTSTGDYSNSNLSGLKLNLSILKSTSKPIIPNLNYIRHQFYNVGKKMRKHGRLIKLLVDYV